MAKRSRKIKILHDYREKRPWDDVYFGDDFEVDAVNMKTGDYTVEGMEDIVRIEKKANWEEIMLNLSKKKNRINFIKELRRMQKYPIRLLLVQDSMDRICHMKLHNVHTTPMMVMSFLSDIVVDYGVTLIPVGTRIKSKIFIRDIFRKIHDGNKSGTLFLYK